MLQLYFKKVIKNSVVYLACIVKVATFALALKEKQSDTVDMLAGFIDKAYKIFFLKKNFQKNLELINKSSYLCIRFRSKKRAIPKSNFIKKRSLTN